MILVLFFKSKDNDFQIHTWAIEFVSQMYNFSNSKYLDPTAKG